jgi:hypothetical protein
MQLTHRGAVKKMQVIYPTGKWHGFAAGQSIVMLIQTMGATANDEEFAHPVGSLAKVEAVVNLGRQGNGVHVTVGEGDYAICNTFDDLDVLKLGRLPFHKL